MSNLPMFGLQANDKPLVGKICTLLGRGSYRYDIVDQSPCGKYVRIKRATAKSRRRWVAATQVFNVK